MGATVAFFESISLDFKFLSEAAVNATDQSELKQNKNKKEGNDSGSISTYMQKFKK